MKYAVTTASRGAAEDNNQGREPLGMANRFLAP